MWPSCPIACGPPASWSGSARRAARMAMRLPTTSAGSASPAPAVSRGGEGCPHQQPPAEQPQIEHEEASSNGEAVKRPAPERGGERDCPQQGRDIARDQQHRGQRAAPVAHPHPALAEPAATSRADPTRPARCPDPARLLAHRGVQVSGEVAAAGDHGARSRSGGKAHEHRPQAERAEPQPELIILGQAGGGEGQAAMGGGKPRRARRARSRSRPRRAGLRRRPPRARPVP